MIYTIIVKNTNAVTFKTGTTDHLEERLARYLTHGLDLDLIDVREGTQEDEKQIHKLYKSFGFKRVYRVNPVTGRRVCTEFFHKPGNLNRTKLKSEILGLLNNRA